MNRYYLQNCLLPMSICLMCKNTCKHLYKIANFIDTNKGYTKEHIKINYRELMSEETDMSACPLKLVGN